MKNSVSVIVVTYNRPENLKRCLESIFRQSKKASEVIVIDNSNQINKHKNEFVCEKYSKILPVVVIKNDINSLTVGRNLGVQNATSDVVVFLDDDVLIGNKYLETAFQLLQQDETIIGVQGYIRPLAINKSREIIHRLFFWYHHRKNQSLVLPSISAVYPSDISGNLRCEWVSGTNQVYRKFVVDEIKWDENLHKYCDGEDLDHSYRVYLQYPKGIIMTSKLAVEHLEEDTGRVTSKELIFMREIYGWYLHKKLFARGYIDLIKFLWSRVGRLLIAMALLVKSPSRNRLDEFSSLIRAYLYVLKNRQEISKGNLKEINKALFGA